MKNSCSVKTKMYELVRLLENDGIDESLRQCYRGQIIAYYDVLEDELNENQQTKIKNILGWQ